MKKRENSYITETAKRISWPYIITISLLLNAVVICFDYYNLISTALLMLPTVLLVPILFFLLAFVISWLLGNKVFDLLKLPCTNAIDTIIIIAIGTTILFLLYLSISGMFKTYKIIVDAMCFVALLLVAVGRANKTKTQNEQRCKLLDLKDIKDNNFELDKGHLVLIDDSSACYDLFNRESFVNQLIMTIVCARADNAITVGLEGPWGSGKSTVLNIVRERVEKEYKERIIIIDDFDPWVLGSQEAILLSLFDTILHRTGIRFSLSQSKKIERSIKLTVASVSSATSIFHSLLFFEKSDYERICEIREELVAFLKQSTKRFVIIIDNIDRASGDNILFLLKLVATYFNLPNITYVIAYDRKRIENVLYDEKKIEPHYLDKIIQVSFQMPQISRSKLKELYIECFKNLIKKEGLDSPFDCEAICCMLSENTSDIRTLKRLINSVFNTVFMTDSCLSERDLFFIEVIHFLAPDLYESILNNKKYFISDDKMFDDDLDFFIFDEEGFNHDGKDYFDALFKEYPNYINPLS